MLIAAAVIIATQDTHAYNCCEPAPRCPQACGQIFFDAEALYLRAYQGGLSSVCDITTTSDSVEDNILVSRLTGRGHDPDFKWNWGYRIGAGYKFAGSDCGLRAYWTHFDANTGGSSHKWKIDYNVVDLVYRCDSNWSRCITVSPYAGIRYANIDQKLHTNFVSTVSDIPNTLNGSVKQDFSGVGPMIGVEGDFGMQNGFSLYGNISIALLYGTAHIRSNSTETFDTGINIDNLRNNKDAYQYVFDAGLGIRYKTCFFCDKNLVIQLGLEDHRYFNHNQFCDYGDLSLDGVTLGISLEY